MLYVRIVSAQTVLAISLNLKKNSIEVLNFEGQLVVKKIIKKRNIFFLLSKNGNQIKETEINENSDIQVWGIVTYVIHKTT